MKQFVCESRWCMLDYVFCMNFFLMQPGHWSAIIGLRLSTSSFSQPWSWHWPCNKTQLSGMLAFVALWIDHAFSFKATCHSSSSHSYFLRMTKLCPGGPIRQFVSVLRPGVGLYLPTLASALTVNYTWRHYKSQWMLRMSVVPGSVSERLPLMECDDPMSGTSWGCWGVFLWWVMRELVLSSEWGQRLLSDDGS